MKMQQKMSNASSSKKPSTDPTTIPAIAPPLSPWPVWLAPDAPLPLPLPLAPDVDDAPAPDALVDVEDELPLVEVDKRFDAVEKTGIVTS